MSRKKRTQEPCGEPAPKPYVDWIMRHELLSSCGLTLVMGLAVGGVASFLNWLLV